MFLKVFCEKGTFRKILTYFWKSLELKLYFTVDPDWSRNTVITLVLVKRESLGWGKCLGWMTMAQSGPWIVGPLRQGSHRPQCGMAPRSAGNTGKVAPEKKEEKETKSSANGLVVAAEDVAGPAPRSFVHKYIFPGPLYNCSCR